VSLPGHEDNLKVVLLESVERRTLLDATIVQDQPATLVDGDGSQITITVEGPGTAWADASRGRLSLSLSGGSSETDLNITVSGGDGRALTRSIRISGPIATIDAPKVELRGLFKAKSIDSATFLAISYADVQTGWIGTLTTRRIDHSRIFSDRLGKITVSGNVEASRIFVSPANDRPVALESVKIKGELTSSSIFALGDIGSVTAAAMIESNVTAGVRIYAISTLEHLKQPLPDQRSGDALYDFIGKYSIRKAIVSGKTSRAIAFSNTVIGAYELGDVRLIKVDGRATLLQEFGVAGYKVGTIQRSFDAATALSAAVANSTTSFRVRQIGQPLTYDPSTGTYSGSGGSSGSVVDYGGSFRGYTRYIPIEGLQIGTVANHASAEVYLAHDGSYELRNSADAVILTTATLGELAAALFLGTETSLKIDKDSGGNNVTLRTTSISPALTLRLKELGTAAASGYDADGQPTYERPPGTVDIADLGMLATYWQGGSTNPIPLPPEVIYEPVATKMVRQLPSLSELAATLREALNVPVQMFERPLYPVNESSKLGRLVAVLGKRNVRVTQDFTFTAGRQSSHDLGALTVAASADRIGSRRLPARWTIREDGTVVVYGLPDGSTLVVQPGALGETALNAVGELKTLPSSDQLKASLAAAGIRFAK
jgi:hypothetical protein